MIFSSKKYLLFQLSLLFFFIFMLSHSNITYSSASKALIIWFQKIVPTLLPVLIISNLIVTTKTWELFTPILHPFFKTLFSTSPSGSFAITLGVLCGYPIGAKIASDLYIKKEISYSEAKRLLTFITFPSPMFLNGYVLHQCFMKLTSNGSIIIPILFSIYGSAILIGVAQSFKMTPSSNHLPLPKSKHVPLTFEMIQQTLLSSAEILLFAGMYMMFASILAGFLEYYISTPYLPLLVGLLEMTTGISLLSTSHLSFSAICLIAIFLCCFGGLSIVLQTSTVLPKEKGWIQHYFIWKMIHAILAVCLFQIISHLQIFRIFFS